MVVSKDPRVSRHPARVEGDRFRSPKRGQAAGGSLDELTRLTLVTPARSTEDGYVVTKIRALPSRNFRRRSGLTNRESFGAVLAIGRRSPSRAEGAAFD